MKCLTHIILTSTKSKERDEAMVIKKQIENFDFVCILVVQCKTLQIVNIPPKAMLCKAIHLISIQNFCKLLLKTLLNSEEVLTQLPTKRSFYYCFYMGFAKTVFKQKSKENKSFSITRSRQ